jgi:hypothetical protein
MYGKITVEIKGLTPLLMDKLTLESLEGKAKTRTEEVTVEQQAENAAYRAIINEKEQLYIPSEAVYGMIINNAGLFKFGQFAASRILAGAIRIEPEKIPLGTNKFDVDVRAVNTGRGRILKGRAKVSDWHAEFTIVFDKTVINKRMAAVLQEIVASAGRRVGLLSYRPQHKGWFGTFEVTKFKIEKEA